MTHYTAARAVWILGIVLVPLDGAHSIASAQSLGDVARREADRRTQVASGRVYTNADLVSVDPPQAPTAPASPPVATEAGGESTQPASKSAEAPTPTTGETSGEAQLKPREKRDEQYWRTRARDLRGRLAGAEADAAAAEAQLAALEASPQTPTMMREREVVAAALARLQSSVRYRHEELVKFEALVQASSVPAEWIR